MLAFIQLVHDLCDTPLPLRCERQWGARREMPPSIRIAEHFDILKGNQPFVSQSLHGACGDTQRLEQILLRYRQKCFHLQNILEHFLLTLSLGRK